MSNGDLTEPERMVSPDARGDEVARQRQRDTPLTEPQKYWVDRMNAVGKIQRRAELQLLVIVLSPLVFGLGPISVKFGYVSDAVSIDLRPIYPSILALLILTIVGAARAKRSAWREVGRHLVESDERYDTNPSPFEMMGYNDHYAGEMQRVHQLYPLVLFVAAAYGGLFCIQYIRDTPYSTVTLLASLYGLVFTVLAFIHVFRMNEAYRGDAIRAGVRPTVKVPWLARLLKPKSSDADVSVR